jgi:hypothetical protein
LAEDLAVQTFIELDARNTGRFTVGHTGYRRRDGRRNAAGGATATTILVGDEGIHDAVTVADTGYVELNQPLKKDPPIAGGLGTMCKSLY